MLSSVCTNSYLTFVYFYIAYWYITGSVPVLPAYSVAGPTVWNLLPDCLHDLALSSDHFRQLLKANLFWRYH